MLHSGRARATKGTPMAAVRRAPQDYRERMRACAQALGLKPPEIVMPGDRWVRLNGIDCHYLDWGNPHLPHVVLLHGGGLTAHTWDMAALLLRDRYHLVALDQRNHGDSEWTPDGQLERDGGELMLEDTRQFLEHLGYDHCALAGMSMGGMNAIRYAARHPQRLDALVIVDVGPQLMREGTLEISQFVRDVETMDRFEDFLARAVQFNPQRKPDHLAYSLWHSLRETGDGRWTWKQAPRRGAQTREPSEQELAEARERNTQRLWAAVRAIRTPTLLMRGSISRVLAQDAAEAMVAAMHDARLVVIEGAGHSVQGDQPQAFASALDAFVSSRVQRRG
ncbi:MAG: alpha/beta hydrolase [Dehalococcoidia bacterium]|nr:alpha/beta hydrolase [Dehalococcoidia bacterium]